MGKRRKREKYRGKGNIYHEMIKTIEIHTGKVYADT